MLSYSIVFEQFFFWKRPKAGTWGRRQVSRYTVYSYWPAFSFCLTACKQSAFKRWKTWISYGPPVLRIWPNLKRKICASSRLILYTLWHLSFLSSSLILYFPFISELDAALQFSPLFFALQKLNSDPQLPPKYIQIYRTAVLAVWIPDHLATVFKFSPSLFLHHWAHVLSTLKILKAPMFGPKRRSDISWGFETQQFQNLSIFGIKSVLSFLLSPPHEECSGLLQAYHIYNHL